MAGPVTGSDRSTDAGAPVATPMPTVPPPVDGGLDSCASVDVTATTTLRPVDIIWVVDSSGSMSNEAGRVQDNMNRFASTILGAGIDPHVVVITDPSYVTVPAPLGTDATHYRFVDQRVRSHAPLDRLLSEWDRYADFLRPDAVTHIVAVTDDESDLDALDFDAQMTAHLGHGYTFDAIASEDAGGGAPCDGAARVGAQYYDLADTTGGLKLSICTTDWTSVIDELAASVAETAPLPCTFDVPAAPAGESLDFMHVNVQHSTADGATTIFPYVGSAGSCSGSGGWYYDDSSAPTQIELCPSSCMVVGAGTGGSVDIGLGCATVLL